MMNTAIIFLTSYLYLFVILGAFIVAVFIKPEERKPLLLLALIVLPVAYIVGELAGLLIQNPRPFVTEQITPLIPHDPTNGFPSSHALLTMTVASIVFVYSKKAGVILLVMALLVGLGSVLAQVHSPIDILGSIIIAVVVTWTVSRLINKINITYVHQK